MAKDYLGLYATNGVKKFQMGGEMAPEAAPAAPAGGGADLEGMVMQYAETKDPAMAVQIADALVSMLAGQQGGAPAGAAPSMGDGGRMSYNSPKMFKKGGKLKV
tara:strand:+ start:157 stop:468 length:312 start_codon:yes stop_codon:yes gene_type:complete